MKEISTRNCVATRPVLNTSQRADKDGSPAWSWAGVNISPLNTHTHTHTEHVTKCHTGPRTWTDPLKRPQHHKIDSPCGLVVANSYEEDNEASVP